MTKLNLLLLSFTIGLSANLASVSIVHAEEQQQPEIIQPDGASNGDEDTVYDNSENT